MTKSLNKFEMQRELKRIKLHKDWLRMNRLKQKGIQIKNNSNITKSKILMRRSFGSLKLGFFSDSGFRNSDLIID